MFRLLFLLRVDILMGMMFWMCCGMFVMGCGRSFWGSVF